jgi:hypothetical protein
MKSININYLNELARSLLFENKAQINLPVDDGMYASNSRMSMYDTPGPNISGDQEYEESYIEEDLPLTAHDFVSNQSLIQIDFDPYDPEFVPDNKTELSSAIAASLDHIGNNDLSKKEIEKAWKQFTNILDKVK